MTENELKYWAFLGHSQEDNRAQRSSGGDLCLCWGDWLREAIHHFSVPPDFAHQINARGEIIPERIEPLYHNAQGMAEEGDLDGETRAALEQSRYLVVICSPRSARSGPLNEAVRYFKQLGRGNRILAIVVAGEPNASDGDKPGRSAEDECFVPAMRHPVKADGTLDATRRERGYIFADARQGEDKREILAGDYRAAETELEMAKLQLIAGLIGVGFNGLLRREQKRRFTGFAEAQYQAKEAQKQIQDARSLAREAQQQAEAARVQAEQAHARVLEAETRAREAQDKVREILERARAAQSEESKTAETELARLAQGEIETARKEAREAEKRISEAENQARSARTQVEEIRRQAEQAHAEMERVRKELRGAQDSMAVAREQALDAQKRAEEMQNQTQRTRGEVEQLRGELREAREKAAAAAERVAALEGEIKRLQASEAAGAQGVQQATEAAERRTLELRHQLEAAQSALAAARAEAEAVGQRVREADDRARMAREKVQNVQRQTATSRRLTKVFAVLAALALMAAGSAWWKARTANQSVVKAAPEVATNSPTVADDFQQTLEHYDGGVRGLDDLSARIRAEEIPGALKASSAIGEVGLRSRIQKQLLMRLAGANPDAALDWASHAEQRRAALEAAIPSLVANYATNLLAAMNDLKPAPDRATYTWLFQCWATNDPAQAIEQRERVPGGDADGAILCAIVTSWAGKDPMAAGDWLKGQPDSEIKKQAVVAWLQAVAKADAPKSLDAAQLLSAAGDMVKALAPGDFRRKAVAELAARWGEVDGAAAMAWAQSLPAETDRLTASEAVIGGWARKDPLTTLPYLNQHPDLGTNAFRAVAEALGQKDVAAATNWVQGLPGGETKDVALLALANVTAGQAPELATNLFASVTNSVPPKEIVVGIARSLAAGNVSNAVEWARSLKDDSARDAALSAAGGGLTKRDLPGAVAILKQISDVELRHNNLEAAARDCDLGRAEDAAKFIATLPADDDQKALIKGLLAHWPSEDERGKLAWLTSFPETNAQPELVQGVLKGWSQREPGAAAQWLTNAPSSDELTSVFLAGAADKYPEFAAEWTQSITNDATRQKYVVQVARQWMKNDPAAAAKWIDGLNLPEDIKQSAKAP